MTDPTSDPETDRTTGLAADAGPPDATAAAHAAARHAADELLLAHPALRGVAVLLDFDGAGNDRPAATAWATRDSEPGPAATVGLTLVLTRELGRLHARLRGQAEAARDTLTALFRLRLTADTGPPRE